MFRIMTHAIKHKNENRLLQRCPPTSGCASAPNGGLDTLTAGRADLVFQNTSFFCRCISLKVLNISTQHFSRCSASSVDENALTYFPVGDSEGEKQLVFSW